MVPVRPEGRRLPAPDVSSSAASPGSRLQEPEREPPVQDASSSAGRRGSHPPEPDSEAPPERRAKPSGREIRRLDSAAPARSPTTPRACRSDTHAVAPRTLATPHRRRRDKRGEARRRQTRVRSCEARRFRTGDRSSARVGRPTKARADSRPCACRCWPGASAGARLAPARAAQRAIASRSGVHQPRSDSHSSRDRRSGSATARSSRSMAARTQPTAQRPAGCRTRAGTS